MNSAYNDCRSCRTLHAALKGCFRTRPVLLNALRRKLELDGFLRKQKKPGLLKTQRGFDSEISPLSHWKAQLGRDFEPPIEMGIYI
ncbi:hypothetical protein CEXT_407891 [Caerostris extrusa]|uniref:Uncharacterized protein n=1 Tax=Caerostris extrusa TaxID=172846 RepID=A0AAV4W5U3_CAEEX|nr:hypothetical protein CEXT_407891 [Caerostris extrusa]